MLNYGEISSGATRIQNSESPENCNRHQFSVSNLLRLSGRKRTTAQVDEGKLCANLLHTCVFVLFMGSTALI